MQKICCQLCILTTVILDHSIAFCVDYILLLMYSVGSRFLHEISLVMRKLDFCLCENKGTDQLCSNCTADQRLCFCYTESTIPLLLKSKISSFKSYSLAAQAGMCGTWSEIPKTSFLASQPKWYMTTWSIARYSVISVITVNKCWRSSFYLWAFFKG